MPNAENAKIQLEQGQELVAFAAMTDSGDHQTLTPAAADKVFSGKAGKEPVIRPNGIVSGRNLVSVAASGSNDVVDVAAFTAYSQGVLLTVAADTDVALTRAVATDTHCINSITMTSAGAVAVVVGTDGVAFSETRGAAGGPPLIPVDSVELAQVRMASNVAAAITADEIFQVIGQHTERFDFPAFEVENIGAGEVAEVAAERNAHVKLASALPLIHTGPIAKKVYSQYYTQIFADLSKTLDFKAVEKSHSVSSSQYYGGSVASSSESLGQGGFTALLSDGITDALVADKNQTLTVKHFPDRNKSAYSLTQGKIGLSRSWPVADQIQASVTISAENETVEFSS
jgi:hypothetical protein